jgi:hypothetical protein
MLPLERLEERVGVRSVGREPTAHAVVVRLQAPARLVERAPHAIAQRVELDDGAAKARGVRPLLGAHGQHRRERAGEAALHRLPLELVRARRARVRAVARPRLARLHVVGLRRRAVDAHHRAVHHAARIVQVPLQHARVQRVLPQPMPTAEGLVLALVLVLAPVPTLARVLRQLPPVRLLGRGGALAALAQEHAGRCLLARLLLEEGRLDRPVALTHHAHRLGHRGEGLAHVEAHVVHLGLGALVVEPVPLAGVVQDRAAHALELGRVGRVVVDAALRIRVQLGVQEVDAQLRRDAKVLDGARVLLLGHLARHVRDPLLERVPRVDLAVLGRAHLRAVRLDGAARLVEVPARVLVHAPLARGVVNLGRAHGVQAQLGQRAAHVRHVLPARGGVIAEVAVDADPALAAPVVAPAGHVHPKVRGFHVRVVRARRVFERQQLARLVGPQFHGLLQLRERRRRRRLALGQSPSRLDGLVVLAQGRLRVRRDRRDVVAQQREACGPPHLPRRVLRGLQARSRRSKLALATVSMRSVAGSSRASPSASATSVATSERHSNEPTQSSTLRDAFLVDAYSRSSVSRTTASDVLVPSPTHPLQTSQWLAHNAGARHMSMPSITE